MWPSPATGAGKGDDQTHDRWLARPGRCACRIPVSGSGHRFAPCLKVKAGSCHWRAKQDRLHGSCSAGSGSIGMVGASAYRGNRPQQRSGGPAARRRGTSSRVRHRRAGAVLAVVLTALGVSVILAGYVSNLSGTAASPARQASSPSRAVAVPRGLPAGRQGRGDALLPSRPVTAQLLSEPAGTQSRGIPEQHRGNYGCRRPSRWPGCSCHPATVGQTPHRFHGERGRDARAAVSCSTDADGISAWAAGPAASQSFA
jgi:hypothetical protein